MTVRSVNEASVEDSSPYRVADAAVTWIRWDGMGWDWDWIGLGWVGSDRSVLQYMLVDWVGLDECGLDWVGLESGSKWTGLDG